MEDYIFDLWINSDTKTDSRLVISNKVASIFLQLKKETNLKTTDLIKTKYSDFIELHNKPNSYILMQKYFKGSTKKSLLVEVKEVKEEKLEEKAFARIKVTKKGGKTRNSIEEVISTAKHSLSYSPEVINVDKKQYILNFPLRCLFAKEEDYYIINNEQLDIIGTGETQDEAEQNFNEEFDYLYERLNSLENNQLNKRLLRIKSVLNSFVKEVF